MTTTLTYVHKQVGLFLSEPCAALRKQMKLEWLFDRIIAHQLHPKVSSMDLQHWKLIEANDKWILSMEYQGNTIVAEQHDRPVCPLPFKGLIVHNKTIMFPDEFLATCGRS